MVLSSGEGSVSSLLVDRLYFGGWPHTQEYLGSTLDLVCYLKKNSEKGHSVGRGWRCGRYGRSWG